MSCLVCQPFTGSSVLQERILETSATILIVNTVALVAQNYCTATKTMITCRSWQGRFLVKLFRFLWITLTWNFCDLHLALSCGYPTDTHSIDLSGSYSECCERVQLESSWFPSWLLPRWRYSTEVGFHHAQKQLPEFVAVNWVHCHKFWQLFLSMKT